MSLRQVIAPTYFYPTGGSDGWSRIVMAAVYMHAVLLNPNSGSGQQQDQAFLDVARQSQAAGMKVLGYVDSAYGARAIQDIVHEFQAYSSWYNVDGFFMDDMYIAGQCPLLLSHWYLPFKIASALHR